MGNKNVNTSNQTIVDKTAQDTKSDSDDDFDIDMDATEILFLKEFLHRAYPEWPRVSESTLQVVAMFWIS